MTHRVSSLVLAMALALAAASVVGAQQSSLPATPAPQAPGAPLLNINTAGAADLEKLPGVGPAMAARIIEYRQKSGAFKKTEELMNVKGIGEKTFLALKPLITVTPPKASGLWVGRSVGR